MIKKIIKLYKTIYSIDKRLDFLQQAIGRIEIRQTIMPCDSNNNMSEFKVYSQSGEDGIIQNLISKLPSNISKTFIEFGVENYLESNTRFLALNNYWSGVIIDGDIENINFIKNDPIYWRCNIKAEHSFITKDNINDILFKSGMVGEIGLLSIDIDGNDYWVFDAINIVRPAIIVAEYNSFFGPKRKVTIPYKSDFVRSNAHYSHLFYGASIAALTHVANKKGYKLVASNLSGNNVFFVREDLMLNFNEISNEEAYRKINFRESHNKSGELLFYSFQDAKHLIDELKVLDIETNQELEIKSIL